MTFPIHKNSTISAPSKAKYPLAEMEIGDVFYIPLGGDDLPQEAQARVHNALRRYRQRHNPDFRIKTRTVPYLKGLAIAVQRTH